MDQVEKNWFQNSKQITILQIHYVSQPLTSLVHLWVPRSLIDSLPCAEHKTGDSDRIMSKTEEESCPEEAEHSGFCHFILQLGFCHYFIHIFFGTILTERIVLLLKGQRKLCWDDLRSLTFQNSSTLRRVVAFMAIDFLRCFDVLSD